MENDAKIDAKWRPRSLGKPKIHKKYAFSRIFDTCPAYIFVNLPLYVFFLTCAFFLQKKKENQKITNIFLNLSKIITNVKKTNQTAPAAYTTGHLGFPKQVC